MSHANDLQQTCADIAGRASILNYLMDAPLYHEGGFLRLVGVFLERQSSGSDQPYAMVDPAIGRAFGITRFMEIDAGNDCVEIGTLIGREYQSQGLNLTSKLLMLSHAFDVMRAARVQFKIDVRNTASIASIERLGAKREGIARDHIRMWDGWRRSSATYSVLAREWVELKPKIEHDIQTSGVAEHAA